MNEAAFDSFSSFLPCLFLVLIVLAVGHAANKKSCNCLLSSHVMFHPPQYNHTARSPTAAVSQVTLHLILLILPATDTCCASICNAAGLDDAGLSCKQSVVARALALHASLISQGPLQALQAVGGLEIAAMAGAYLEAGRLRMPTIVDGFISGA